jgi:hypothetical protein
MININKNFSPEQNFWDLNAQLAIIKPFSILYNNDKSKDKKQSSDQAWCIFFISESDETKNLFFRIPEKERIEMLEEVYGLKLANNKFVKDCIDAYPELVMTSVERSLKDMKDLLTKRAKVLLKMDYNLETGKFIDDAIAKNLKIYQDFEKIQVMFNQEQKKTIVRGGRQLSAMERGEL